MIGNHSPFADVMAEEELLTLVMHMAKQLGWRRYHVRNSKAGIVQGETGFPDLVLVRGPRVIFAELKTEKGRASPEQIEWLTWLLAADLHATIWRPSDWFSGKIQRELEQR